MKTLTRVVLETKRNSSGRRAQAEYARNNPDSDVAKRVAARAHGAKPKSAGLEKDFIGRFKPKEGQHARHMQTGQTASQRQTSREIKDYAENKPGRIKDRQNVRRGQEVDPPSEQELDNHIKRGRANKPPRRRGDKVVRGGVYDNTAYPLTANRVFMFEGKYKDQRMAAERGEAKGALRGPIAQAAMRKLKGSKGKMVGGKLKPATSKAARQSYRNAARSEAGTSRPVKAPEDSLPQGFKGGIAGSTEDIQNQVARRGHSR